MSQPVQPATGRPVAPDGYQSPHYGTCEVEVTELCPQRALTAEEQARAEQQIRECLAPFAARIRTSRDGTSEAG
ncbi:hypothetical protein [Streptomyces sp. NBC_00140]|uniref:hypothetical protein n=1 Tax=Streptomyces sp. NBC_00140 TaxID=2975664 RepID=UPI0022577A85|nr:hypothetical protein [Streptomyces sp. NBC_00140]MCX5328635.1 hypothetical protein [Streptomyces sp. NBC_00140]